MTRPYYLDLQRARSDNSSAFVQMAAQELQARSYFLLGEWLAARSLPELEALSDLCEEAVAGSNDRLAEALRLVMVLACAEGLEVPDEDAAAAMLEELVCLVAIARLARENVLTVCWSRMSLESLGAPLRLTDAAYDEMAARVRSS